MSTWSGDFARSTTPIAAGEDDGMNEKTMLGDLAAFGVTAEVTPETPRHFAEFGSEKMIFDVRLGPQAVCHDDIIYIVYQANPHGLATHPHIIAYDRRARSWSRPVRLGENPPRYDHHLAPVLWIDDQDHLHVLYGCHLTPGTHLVSRKPRAIDEWTPGPPIANSISYPTLVRAHDNTLVLFYRALGHLGFWAYRTSGDGGYSWSAARRLIHFAQSPSEDDDADCWAGVYPSVCPSPDGRSLHIGFVYWDERRGVHPVYQIRRRSRARYHLYYLRLDIPSGALYTIDCKRLKAPVNRGLADAACKVWDTGYELSNMPSIALGAQGEPHFLLPVSDQSAWHSRFHFVTRQGRAWHRVALTGTNNTWAGGLLRAEGPNDFVAYLVSGQDADETLFYSGGTVEQWSSRDRGVTWHRDRSLVPDPDLVYNNPRPVQNSRGGDLRDHLVFFGWQGPGSIEADPSPLRNRGRAYLWGGGEWL